MTDLQQQILARIDATPYRPPTINDFTGQRAAISCALAELMTAREIDTATGDSGTTYTRRKVYADAPSPHAPAPIPQTAHAGLAYFPSRSPTAQPAWHGPENTPSQRATIRACTVPRLQTKAELAAQARAHNAAERAKAKAAKPAKVESKRKSVTKIVTARSIAETVDAHLAGAMSAAQFAKAAGVSKTVASSMLYRSVARGRIFHDTKSRPKLYFFAVPVAEQIAEFRASAQDLKRRQDGLEPDKIAAEYVTGAKIKDQAARWGTSIKTIRAILRSEKVTLRTPQECAAVLRGVERDMTPEHRQKCRETLAKARAEGRLKHQALKDENAALKAELAELGSYRNKRVDAFAGRAEA
jgi:hypothetical protein